MQRLEKSYRHYVISKSNVEVILSRSEFLDKLLNDDNFNKKFGKNITRLMGLDERLEIAYPDKEERMVTLIFMGSKPMKKLLNKLNIPKRKILRPQNEIDEFLSQQKKQHHENESYN